MSNIRNQELREFKRLASKHYEGKINLYQYYDGEVRDIEFPFEAKASFDLYSTVISCQLYTIITIESMFSAN